jgi:hypothetical protein
MKRIDRIVFIKKSALSAQSDQSAFKLKQRRKMEKQTDVMAILKLYELRREEQMRAARQWYLSEFAPKSATDIIKLFRDVLNGGIDEKMFLDSGSEYIFVYSKIEPFLAEIRQMFQEPDYLINLENLVRKTPRAEAKIESRKRLAAIWTRQEKEISAGEKN